MAKRIKNLVTSIKQVTNPDRWDLTHGSYLTGRAMIDGVDNLAMAMERKWGVDRLRLLVPVEIREKFDRQRYLWAAAIQNGDLEAIRRESARMSAGWWACDRLAKGAAPLVHAVLEVGLEDGTVAGIVEDAASVALIRTEGRAMSVFTLAEVGKILSHYKAVNQLKTSFPGAKVIRATMPTDPLDGIDHPTGLDTPFDDEIKIAR